MVLLVYVFRALAAAILSAATFGPSWLSALNSRAHQQLAPQSQFSFEGPGCDGSGIVDPDGRCNGDGLIDDPQPDDKYRDGFHFENPSTDCKYVSQMYIWDSFKTLESDANKLFTLIHKNVSFTIVGHHPAAGHYNDLMHFYVNALRRVVMIFSVHANKFRINPKAIHGGCNAQCASDIFQFRSVGEPFEIVNVWVSRWREGQMVEVRTYIDAGALIQGLHQNEIWWNGSTTQNHLQYMPGPGGMPNLRELEGLMGYPNGSKYVD